jgi:hypothetical protein
MLIDYRLLPQLIDPEGDCVAGPLGFDHRDAGLAIERERHGD